MGGCLGVDVGEQFVLFEYIFYSIDGQGTAIFVDKEAGGGGIQLIPNAEPGRQLILDISRGNVKQTLPAAFPADQDRLGDFIPVFQAQAGDFADAQAETEEELQNTYIPDADYLSKARGETGVFCFRGADERAELRLAQNSREGFGQLKVAGGKAETVFLRVTLLKEIGAELADGDVLAVNGLGLQTALELPEVACQNFCIQLLGICLLKPVEELQQIIAVGKEGFGGQVALQRQRRKKVVN